MPVENPLDGPLSQDVAVVTGAGGEIGRATTLRLAQAGSAVVALDRDGDAAGETRDAVVSGGGRAIAIAADVADRAGIRRAIETAERELGPITIAVNNAAISPISPFLEMSDEHWHEVLQTNLTGCFTVSQEAARAMLAHGHGRIVNVSSTAARRAHENLGAYAASKAGIEALTRQMAFELGPLGIRVNGVAPGPIMTALNRAVLNDAARAARVKRMPAGRLGQPADIAGVVAFLVSDDSAFLHGTMISAEGGFFIAGVRANPD